MDYIPLCGKRELFPSASLELCDIPCNLQELRTHVDLATRHIGKGCDRDTYSIQSQKKRCGALPSTIDLLLSGSLISRRGHQFVVGGLILNSFSTDSELVQNWLTRTVWLLHESSYPHHTTLLSLTVRDGTFRDVSIHRVAFLRSRHVSVFRRSSFSWCLLMTLFFGENHHKINKTNTNGIKCILRNKKTAQYLKEKEREDFLPTMTPTDNKNGRNN